MAGKQVKLTNGLGRLLVADIDPLQEGGYGEIYEVARLSSISAETAENEVSLSAGNTTVFSLRTIGKTTGSLTFYGMTDEAEAKLFDVRKGKSGGKIYGANAQRGAKALIIECTVINPETNLEEMAHIIFPKTTVGILNDEGTTKDSDGNMTINTKSLSFTAFPLDNSFKTYKYINIAATPEALTKDMFDVAE